MTTIPVTVHGMNPMTSLKRGVLQILPHHSLLTVDEAGTIFAVEPIVHHTGLGAVRANEWMRRVVDGACFLSNIDAWSI